MILEKFASGCIEACSKVFSSLKKHKDNWKKENQLMLFGKKSNIESKTHEKKGRKTHGWEMQQASV